MVLLEESTAPEKRQATLMLDYSQQIIKNGKCEKKMTLDIKFAFLCKY